MPKIANAVLGLVITGLALSAGLLPAAAMELEPTATCPADAVAEVRTAIEFVRAQTWAVEPGGMALMPGAGPRQLPCGAPRRTARS